MVKYHLLGEKIQCTALASRFVANGEKGQSALRRETEVAARGHQGSPHVGAWPAILHGKRLQASHGCLLADAGQDSSEPGGLYGACGGQMQAERRRAR